MDSLDGRATDPGDVVDVEGVSLAHGLSRAIKTLVSARAFAELDTFIPFSKMVGVHLRDLQALVARDVVEQKDDVLFGVGFAVKLTNLAPRGVLLQWLIGSPLYQWDDGTLASSSVSMAGMAAVGLLKVA